MSDSSGENASPEKHYTTAVIFTVLALYSISVYSYFNNSKATASTALRSEVFDNSIELTNTLTADVLGKEQLFRPINNDEVTFVPGAECVLTDRNFTPAGTFYMLPPDCDFAAEGD